MKAGHIGGPAVALVVAASLAGAGCFSSTDKPGFDAGPPDSGPAVDAPRPPPGDAGPTCRFDRECRDDLFCNGVESCLPDNPRADAFGCVAGNPACTDGLLCTIEADPDCDEDVDRCGAVTLDHAACPEGFYCRATWGCTAAPTCPTDGSACPDEDTTDCSPVMCQTIAGASLCIPGSAPDGTPCMWAGAFGTCRGGSCCTTC